MIERTVHISRSGDVVTRLVVPEGDVLRSREEDASCHLHEGLAGLLQHPTAKFVECAVVSHTRLLDVGLPLTPGLLCIGDSHGDRAQVIATDVHTRGQLFGRPVIGCGRDVTPQVKHSLVGPVTVERRVRIEHAQHSTVKLKITSVLLREGVQDGPKILASIEGDGVDVVPHLTSRVSLGRKVPAHPRVPPTALSLAQQRVHDLAEGGVGESTLLFGVEAGNDPGLTKLPAIVRHGELHVACTIGRVALAADVDEPHAGVFAEGLRIERGQLNGYFAVTIQILVAGGGAQVLQRQGRQIVERHTQSKVERQRDLPATLTVGVVRHKSVAQTYSGDVRQGQSRFTLGSTLVGDICGTFAATTGLPIHLTHVLDVSFSDINAGCGAFHLAVIDHTAGSQPNFSGIMFDFTGIVDLRSYFNLYRLVCRSFSIVRYVSLYEPANVRGTYGSPREGYFCCSCRRNVVNRTDPLTLSENHVTDIGTLSGVVPSLELHRGERTPTRSVYSLFEIRVIVAVDIGPPDAECGRVVHNQHLNPQRLVYKVRSIGRDVLTRPCVVTISRRDSQSPGPVRVEDEPAIPGYKGVEPNRPLRARRRKVPCDVGVGGSRTYKPRRAVPRNSKSV